MTIALKEIHISNEKKRDANVRFVSLIKENDPKLAYKGKSIKNSRLLISSDETSEESLINKIPVLLYDKWKRYCHYPCKNLDSGNFSRDSLYYTTKSESIKKYINKIAEVSKSDDLDWGKYYSTNKSHPDFNSYLDRVLN